LQLKDKTDSLQKEVHERIQLNKNLENEIEERKRMEFEVERIHRQLVDASRHAGQAEVASSVLHNVGNVLNSVNVSTTLIGDRLKNMRIVNVSKAADLIQTHRQDLGHFLSEDPRGRQLPGYLEQLGTQLAKDQHEIAEEVKELTQNIDHIKEIVAMQQTYAKVAGLTETLSLTELVENALKMQSGANTRHNIEVVRDFAYTPQVTVDRHKILQILVNLLQNAKYACDEGGEKEKRIVVRLGQGEEDRVKIIVVDNGIGIVKENMTRIFAHGFTTRQNGHGFGLHSAALAAKQMGGSLTAHSDGPGRGASFTLEIPRTPAVPEKAGRKNAGEWI
jgi:C4-dicarboxylate-specific signal transduction histidine kinase